MTNLKVGNNAGIVCLARAEFANRFFKLIGTSESDVKNVLCSPVIIFFSVFNLETVRFHLSGSTPCLSSHWRVLPKSGVQCLDMRASSAVSSAVRLLSSSRLTSSTLPPPASSLPLPSTTRLCAGAPCPPKTHWVLRTTTVMSAVAFLCHVVNKCRCIIL